LLQVRISKCVVDIRQSLAGVNLAYQAQILDVDVNRNFLGVDYSTNAGDRNLCFDIDDTFIIAHVPICNTDRAIYGVEGKCFSVKCAGNFRSRKVILC